MYDVATNPIPHSGLWVTMSLEQLQDRLNQLSGAELALASQFVMLTLNACNQLVEDEILSRDIFGC